MATHDYIISNASGAAVRSDLNNALAAIVSNNSNATEPATTYSYMWWADTTAGQLKLRNAANDGWITIQELDGTMLMEDGAVGTPGLAFASDLDTGFYRPADNELGIATGGTNAVYIDNAQQVGIGTAAPGRTLDVNGIIRSDGTSGGLAFGGNSSTPSEGVAIHRPAANTLAFVTDSTERARIDSSGRLLVGTSSARAGYFNTPATYNGRFQLEGANGNAQRILSFVYGDDNTGDPVLLLAKHRSTSTGIATSSLTSVNDGDGLGMLSFQGKTGDEFIEGARVQAIVNGTPGTDDLPTYLRFMTNSGGAGPSERMKIDKDGLLYSVPTYSNTTGSTTNYMRIGANGEMYRSTSSIAYKTDVEDMEDAYADAILNLRPVWYRSTCKGDNPNHSHWGFIAEEVEQIDPRLCSFKEYEASVDEEGKQVVTPLDTPVVDGVDYASLTPLLLNLVKRQKAQIETLEAKVAALESA